MYIDSKIFLCSYFETVVTVGVLMVDADIVAGSRDEIGAGKRGC
jgi:hypothetical protein